MINFRLPTLLFAFVVSIGAGYSGSAMAALDDLLPPVQTETERFPPAEDEDAETSSETEEAEEEPEPQLEPVRPEIEAPDEPLVSSLPTPKTADIQQQIQKLRDALDGRQHALSLSEQRLDYAESLLNRLNNEYESFELRLERAGLNLTDDYANLLRQRLERLRDQTIAAGLTKGKTKKKERTKRAERAEENENK